MQVRGVNTVMLTTAAIFMVIAAVARGDSNEPGTLWQWSYGKQSDKDEGSKLNQPLETDRPDFTESPSTVGRGVFQAESGYTFTHDNSHGDRTADHSFPETLYRLGVGADWFELRAYWDYEVEQTKIGGVTESGADDLVLGMKFALTPQQGCLPETGIILEMSVPTGADAFSADKVLPGIEYCYDWDITKEWSLSGMTALEGAVDEVTNDRYDEFQQTLSLEYSWTEQVKSYTEWYVLSPISADTNGPQYYFDGGFTVLINNDLQWDIRAGAGLNDAADNFYAGSGLSMRFY
ncbi:MAG TPA: transporter [Lacipirellulaceae bacterium]|nr:transporter [Lacipirellulaceae bacterium]